MKNDFAPVNRPLRRLAAGLCLAGLLGGGLLALHSAVPAASAYPKPSLAPVAWQIDMTHRTPRRIVVDVPGRGPQAFWYMIYTATNNTDQERYFLPDIVLHTDDGRNLTADKNVPDAAYDGIRRRVRGLNLVAPSQMVGRLLVGQDESKSSMAVWAEPKVEMGTFDVFFGGLSGEVKEVTNPVSGEPLKDQEGGPILIRKTKQLTFKVRGDAVRPEEDKAVEIQDQWVMR